MNKQDLARRKRLRRMLDGDRDEVAVAVEDLRWLLDEASRLQQANDRLRRQNRRLRLRGGDAAEPSADEPSADDGQA